ncbi:hypothetical protein LA080_006296 [Diaporthe eres]|nr:hypothetical protein LA080_006296 [Diaporthe eres]
MPTIYESFRAAVDPDHVGSGRRVSGGTDGNVHVSAPSNTTRTFEPPNFLLKTPESKWLSIADAALNQHKSRLNQKNTRLAPWEPNMRMDSEGDVVYGSAIYLTNPVHIALHAAQNHSKSCDVRSEVTLGTTSRADMGYFHNDRAYAILEYKRLGAVSKRCTRGDFERGIPKDPKMFTQWMSSAEQRFMRDVRGAEDTRFLLQQAVHYQKKFGARFVALFDWNALVLLVLPPCRGVGLNDRVSYAYVTEVTDNRKFRRALLGFLLFSYQNSIGGQSGNLERIQPDVFPAYAQAYHRRVAEDAKHNRPRRQGPRGERMGNQHPPAVANRPRQQQASGHYIPDDRSTGRGPIPHRQVNPHTNTYTTANSTYSNDTNSTVIHTYITLPGRTETKSPGRRIRKQPSQGLAAEYMNSDGVAVNTQGRDVDRGPGRPRQMHPVTNGAGPYSASKHSYGGRNYANGIPEHFSTHNGNNYHAYPAPSSQQASDSGSTKRVHQDKLAGNRTKEKNGGKFLGIFRTR